jgi:hypothetical protein
MTKSDEFHTSVLSVYLNVFIDSCNLFGAAVYQLASLTSYVLLLTTLWNTILMQKKEGLWIGPPADKLSSCYASPTAYEPIFFSNCVGILFTRMVVALIAWKPSQITTTLGQLMQPEGAGWEYNRLESLHSHHLWDFFHSLIILWNYR